MTPHRIAPALLAALLLTAAAVPVAAQPAEVRNLTPQFANAGLPIEGLQVLEIGGVVILRGRTEARLAAEAAGVHAQSLGFTRVANLIQVVERPNDADIRRRAERELAIHRSLDGTRFSVASENGVIYLRGRVQDELQKDMAVAVLRTVDGVREVRAEVEQE